MGDGETQGEKITIRARGTYGSGCFCSLDWGDDAIITFSCQNRSNKNISSIYYLLYINYTIRNLSIMAAVPKNLALPTLNLPVLRVFSIWYSLVLRMVWPRNRQGSFYLFIYLLISLFIYFCSLGEDKGLLSYQSLQKCRAMRSGWVGVLGCHILPGLWGFPTRASLGQDSPFYFIET